MMALEIERKYLIRMPDEEMLSGLPDAEIWHIVQTYLTDGADGESRRVRSVVQNGTESYIYTEKRHITPIMREELERRIGREEYERLLLQTDPRGNPIRKVRYRVPYRGQTLEIDIYSFWQDRATLEIEMETPDQRVYLPDWIQIIRDVSDEKRYTNKQMSRHVPMEPLA